MKMVKKAVMIVCAGLAALWAWLYFSVENVSGEEFKELVVSSDASSYSSWYLYEQNGDLMCFRYSRPVVPKKYCVPRGDLDVVRGDGTSGFGYVRNGEFALKADRSPGAKRIVF